MISHQALHDTYQTTGTYPVTALIKHRSGIQSATLYYRTDTTWLVSHCNELAQFSD
ncbi:MAG: hypothetical protein U0X76_02995 [Bacteroidia bacterium]